MEERYYNEAAGETGETEGFGAAGETKGFETAEDAPEEIGSGTEEPGEEEPKEFTEEELAAWEEFREAYPELTAENIPEDVFRLVSEGERPVHAMRQVELAALKAENRALRQRLAAVQNESRNRARTPGSMLGRADMPGDAFLAGLGE